MGPQSQYLETVLTCMGDYYSPDFHRQLSVFRDQLQQLIFAGDERSLILKKVEPWNSVRVTFNIPADAAERLRELAQHPNSVLRELGVLAVQIGGDCVMSTNTSGGSSSSCTETKLSDVVTGSGSQAVCQPATSVVFASSTKTNTQSMDLGLPQFKVPTMIVSSCSPTILHPASSAVRTVAVEHPVPDVVSSLNVTQPRPVGLVRWPSVIPGHPGLDAVAVRFAVPPVQMKDFSQGLCFISPLRAAINQNIASSSPLLVNLLQTQRQHGIAAVPSQPVVPVNASAVIVPQKRRRNTSARKAKQPRNDQETFIPTSGLQLTADNTLRFAQTHMLPVTCVRAPGSHSTSATDNQTPMENEKTTDVSLTADTGSARRMINPYTGNLELVDIAEDDSLSVPVSSSAEVSGSNDTSVTKTTVLLNSDQHVTVSGLADQTLPTFIPSKLISAAVKASESSTGRNLLVKSEDISCTEKPIMSTPLLSVPMISTSSQYVDWYTASQSDKHSRPQSDTGQLLFSGGLSGVKHPEIAKSVKLSNVTIPSENLSIGSAKVGTCGLYERCLSTVKPFSTNEQQPATSFSASSTVTASGLESVRPKTVPEITPPQISNLTASGSTVSQLSTAQTDLIQMAFTLAKQNGSALHVSSLVDSWNKNAGLLQSLHGLQNIALATTSIPFHSSSTATTASSPAQSRPKDVDCLTSTTTTVVSSDTCFFPAVSCFPPEQRRKSAVSIGGFGINPEPQLQPGTSGVMTCLVSTLPAVKILTSSSMPLEGKTSGVSVVPSTVSNLVAVSTNVITESDSLSAGTERGLLPSADTKKSIPLLTNLVPSSWPLMPNVLTVPLVTPTPLSGNPLLHCVTRASLTPDGKLAGLSAAVTNAKGTVVPLAGRFCTPLSTSQAALVTTSADKQNAESVIRPHTVMLADNLTRLKLSISGNGSKTSGKHVSSSKDRRGTSTRADDAVVQRSSGKSHLTVAQLLDMAKNARLQQTACDDEQMKLPGEPLAAVLTSASVQPQSTLTKSPVQLSSLPVQSSSTLVTSHDPSQTQLTSLRLSASAAGSIHTPSTSAMLQSNAASSSIASQSTTAVVTSTLFPHLLTQPLNAVTNVSTVSAPLTAAAVDVPGKVSIESSSSASLPVSAYSVHPPLSIMSPRYPLNLTESVKKAMRGVGLYPSPPMSPTTSVQTFGSAKLPEIRPYPISTVCTVTASELAAKKLLQDRGTVIAPIMSQQLLLTASNSAAISSVNRCGPLVANVSSASYQTLNTANCVSRVSSATVCAEITENQTNIKNGDTLSHLEGADLRVVNAVTPIGSTSATDRVTATHDLLFSDVQPQSVTNRSSAHVIMAGTAVVCSIPEPELLSSVLSEDSSLPGHGDTTKTVNSFNGRLSASSGDSDVELRHDVLEGLSSVETDAGLSSLHSSPCSAELANVLDSRRETSTVVANNADVLNCTPAVNHRHNHTAVSLNAELDSPSCEGSLLLQCDTTVEDGYITAVSVASDVSAASDDIRDDQEIDSAADSADLVYLKAATDSSVVSSKHSNTIVKRNRLQTAISNIGNKLTTRRNGSTDVETNIKVISCTGTPSSAEPAVAQQTVTSVGSITRMTTRSTRRTAAPTTELANKTSSNETKPLGQKTPVKTSERRRHRVSESSNHSQDLPTMKSVVVLQRRSARIPVAKVVDMKSETVTTCQDTDSCISLRSRRHTQKMNSIEVVTPRKRAGLRGTAGSKEVSCLVDSTDDAVGVLDGSAGSEVNANEHE